LIAQVAKILLDVVGTWLGQGPGLISGFHRPMRAVSQLADLAADLGRVRPGAILTRIPPQILMSDVCHRLFP
jgi:hypothetical protein